MRLVHTAVFHHFYLSLKKPEGVLNVFIQIIQLSALRVMQLLKSKIDLSVQYL